MNTSTMVLTALLSFAACSSKGATGGHLAARHIGSNDPLSEGFTYEIFNGSPILAPAVGSALPAWRVHVPTPGDIVSYRKVLTPNESAMLSEGWTISATLSIEQPYAAPVCMFVQIAYGATGALAWFNAQPDGDPVVRIGSSNYAFEGAGPGFHKYELRYDPSESGPALYFDGMFAGRGELNTSGGAGYLYWGASQHAGGPQTAYWNEVSLTIVPEPSAATLVLAAGAIWISTRRRTWVRGATP